MVTNLGQEAREKADALERSQEVECKQRDLERKKALVEAQIAALRIGFDSERDELERAISRGRLHRDVIAEDALTMGRAREADAKPPQEGDAAKSGKGERR